MPKINFSVTYFGKLFQNFHKPIDIKFSNVKFYSDCAYNRHKYDKKIEELINDQINTEFTAGYGYLSISNYYARSDVALPGCSAYFMKMYYEEQGHAMGFINYQILRGGVVQLCTIEPLEESCFVDISKTLKFALDTEKEVKEKLQNLYCVANSVNDTNVMDFLDVYVDQQEKSICEMSRLLTRSKMLISSPVGKYLFDRELHETHLKENPAKCSPNIGSKSYT